MQQDVLATTPPLPPPVVFAYWPPAPPARAPMREHRFEFHGQAGEYFRIWIVNLALTLVTLGIYSAWAKVRSERYFYANTRLGGVPFEYLAKPLPILKGRIIAVVLLAAYVLASQFSVVAQLVLVGVILLATPWLIVRGTAFRARYSAWRGLSFRFIADYSEAYVRFLLLLIPMVLTLGMLYPWLQGKQKQFLVEHHRFGGSNFRFLLSPGRFYIPYLIAWAVLSGAIMLCGGLIFALTMATVAGGDSGSAPPPVLLYAVISMIYAVYFVVWVFLAAALVNLVYNHVEIGGRRLRSTLKGQRLLALYASNTLAILISVGLLIPWAKIRLARYRAETLSLLAADDLQDMRAESLGDIDATAAEVDGLFDIDIGL
ncbi:MAG: YjgN family protein [Dokdonella sp.]